MWDKIEKPFQFTDLQVHEVWRQVADEIGGTYLPTSMIKVKNSAITHSPYGALMYRVRGWVITLDASYNRKINTFTIFMKAPILNREGLRFSIYPRTLFGSIGRLLGVQDIEVGDAEFDSEYLIKGSDEEKVKALLASERIRQLMRSSNEVNLSVRGGEAEGGSLLTGVMDYLYWELIEKGSVTEGGFPTREIHHDSIARDPRQVKSLFELFEETLGRLHSMGCIGDAQ
jgi:hypothetical protein